jgi:hypothetical protein
MRWIALVALAAFGCVGSGGGTGPTGSGGTTVPVNRVTIANNGCALPPAGIFLVHYVAGSGNTCGVIPDSLLDGSAMTSSACPGGSGTITDTPVAGGGCTVVADLNNCTFSAGASVDVVEQTTWNIDYSQASGMSYFSITAGSSACAGTYTITLTKQ